MPLFDELVKKGKVTEAVRVFANEYYENGKMGYTRKLVIEQLADKVDRLEKGEIVNYEKMPSRGKVTSDGEKTKKHGITCGGQCYVFYDENRWYRVECENCGTLVIFKTISQDFAIKIWNDMPDAIGS